jgi:MFS family permease
MDMAGATVGILSAALLVWLLPGQYRTIFLIAAVPGLIAVGLTWMIHDDSPGEARVQALAPLRSLPRSFLPTLAVSALYGFAASSDALLLLRASGMGFDALAVVGLYAIANLIASLGAYPAAVWSDRVGRKRLLALGWTIYGFVYLGLAYGGFWFAPWLFAAYGVQLALTEGTVRAWAVDEVPRETRGTALGLFHATVGLSALAGNLAVGRVWDRQGPSQALLISAAASLLACLALFALPSGRAHG